MPEHLLNKELTPGQTRVVHWLTTPRVERAPKTLEDLADELGVTVRTVQRWRRKHNLDALASEAARREIFQDLPMIYRKLSEKAQEGSFHHIRLYLKLVSVYAEKVEITYDGDRSEMAGRVKLLLGDKE